MKKFIIGILAICFMAACHKGVDTYSGEDYIYFDATNDSTFFSYAYVDGNIESDTMWVWIRISGRVTDYNREVRLKIAETNGQSDIDFAPLPESYELIAGRTIVVVPVVLLRPEVLKKEERYLVLELQESDDFKLMWASQPVNSTSGRYYSKIKYKITYSEILNTPPRGWSDTHFGTFSVKKLDKMCQELNMTRLLFNDISYINLRRDYIATKMVGILNAHPVYEDDQVTLMRMGDRYYQ